MYMLIHSVYGICANCLWSENCREYKCHSIPSESTKPMFAIRCLVPALNVHEDLLEFQASTKMWSRWIFNQFKARYSTILENTFNKQPVGRLAEVKTEMFFGILAGYSEKLKTAMMSTREIPWEMRFSLRKNSNVEALQQRCHVC